jgi:tetratricopeptide (TPR) repeat protein
MLEVVRACAGALRDDPSRIVFLVGAGASVASGLPTAWEFHGGLARYLAFRPETEGDLLRMLTTDYVGSGERPIRFEQTVAVFRELYDPELRLLTLFDDAHLEPNGLHDFVASRVLGGAIAITTNFDCLIERAHDRYGRPLDQVCSLGGSKRSPHRFDPDRVGGGTLLKLHGSLRVRHGGVPGRYTRSQAALGATLDALGRGVGTPGLEPMKEACLRAALRDRFLVILGYSGSDDFDVLPSLARTIGEARGVIWVKHVARPRPRVRSARDAALPAFLHAVDGCVAIEGITSAVLRDVLGVSLTETASAPRPDVAASLLGMEPYATLREWNRAIIVARLAEIAAQPTIAARYYQIASRMVQRRGGTARGAGLVRAYALARLGHIHREAGRNAEALRKLNAARKVAHRYRFQTLLADVTVSIGNVYLRIGRLDRALRAYQEALRTNNAVIRRTPRKSRRNRQNVATITSNIGIVHRKRGEYDDALEMFRTSLHLARRLRDRDRIVLAVGNLGNAYYHLQKYDLAARAYDEAVGLARSIGRRVNVSINLANRAIVARLQGEPEIAVDWIEEALALSQSLPYPEGEVNCLVERARNQMARGNIRKALSDGARALEIAQRIQHVEGVADALRLRADAFALRGRKAESDELRAEAEKVTAQLRR